MTRAKVSFRGFHLLLHKIKGNFKRNKGPKYNILKTACCPLCDEEVQVGTAGPQGLNQHQLKKKCLANIEKKRREEKKVKTLTLFFYAMSGQKRKDRD